MSTNGLFPVHFLQNPTLSLFPLPAWPPTLPCSCRTTATPWHLHLPGVKLESLEHSVHGLQPSRYLTLPICPFLVDLVSATWTCQLRFPSINIRLFLHFEACSSFPILNLRRTSSAVTLNHFNLPHNTLLLPPRIEIPTTIEPCDHHFLGNPDHHPRFRSRLPRREAEIKDISQRQLNSRLQGRIGCCHGSPSPFPFCFSNLNTTPPSPSLLYCCGFHGAKKQTNTCPNARSELVEMHHGIISMFYIPLCPAPALLPYASTYCRRFRM
ncbi:hypothetical protein B0T13DRAFT_473458 [Neurospora crassa]|nr:hypothetical protein B0T13DRAFT_473458 [Neurospora crassa]